jgi:hypothetical protein
MVLCSQFELVSFAKKIGPVGLLFQAQVVSLV